jgi:hypothetical protein
VIRFFDLPNLDEAGQDVASGLVCRPEDVVIRPPGVVVHLHRVVAELDDGLHHR